MTGICRPVDDRLGDSEEGSDEATVRGRSDGGCHPARRLKHSLDTGRSGDINTTTNLGKAVKFAQCASDGGQKDFPDPRSIGPLVDISRLPSAAMSGARRTSGIQTVVDSDAAIDSDELGTWVR